MERQLTFLLLLVFKIPVLHTQQNGTLKLLHVLFRHGERAPDEHSFQYPKDPYYQSFYYPAGYGQLSKKGMQTEYKVGEELRQRYGNFLGDYTADVVHAMCTAMERTMTSLEVVLAALFPAKSHMVWNTGLEWQPIPYYYHPLGNDTILGGFACRNLQSHLDVTPQFLDWQRNYSKLIDFVHINTGCTVCHPWLLFMVHSVLSCQESFNLTLPAWSATVYPQLLKEASINLQKVFMSTTTLKQIMIGGLLNKIIKDTQALIDEKLTPINRKLFLYSAHELHVFHLLKAFDIEIESMIEHGAYIALEIHLINEVYGVKVLYQDYSTEEPHVLNILNCGQFCPFPVFVKLVTYMLPGETSWCT